ncbi:MAG: SDR family oxidoreductase [Bacteroidetes bacterium]|nr:MAG: SDR family oxidoreductase [Bacteroidota bacterium]TAG87566.1 MAG: SDR family oxidoreductase [Bacteroidota bacterium]
MKKTALITGASSGFGVEFAKLFAKDQHNLVLVARSNDKLQSLAKEITQQYQVEVLVMSKDLSDMTQVQSVYDELKAKNINIDFLVNNAGFGDFGNFDEAEWSKLEQMIDLNIKSLTKLSYLFVQDMKKRGFGKILHVASTAAFQPGPTMAVYYATKAFVLFLGEAMSNELAKTGVTVTNLCPGPAATGFQAAADLGESKLVKGKKLPTAKEIAIFGYKKMNKGSLTVVPGFMNWVNAFAIRFLPRGLVLKMVRSVQDK